MAGLTGGLADEKSSCWSRLESMRKMGKSSDIRAAVIADLTFDPDVDASDNRVADVNEGDHVRTGIEQEAAEVMVAELTGVRRIRHDIQIRDLEQS